MTTSVFKPHPHLHQREKLFFVSEDFVEYKLTYQLLSDQKKLDKVHWDNKRKVSEVTKISQLTVSILS